MFNEQWGGSEVLVVVEDETLRELLALILETEGYNVATAPDGEWAGWTLRQDGAPRLLVVDLGKSVADGLALLAELARQVNPGGRGETLVAALGPAESETDARDVGANVFLPKPLETRELRNLAEWACRWHHAEEFRLVA